MLVLSARAGTLLISVGSNVHNYKRSPVDPPRGTRETKHSQREGQKNAGSVMSDTALFIASANSANTPPGSGIGGGSERGGVPSFGEFCPSL